MQVTNANAKASEQRNGAVADSVHASAVSTADLSPPKGAPSVRTLLEFLAWQVHTLEHPQAGPHDAARLTNKPSRIGGQQISLRQELGAVEEAAKRIKVPLL